MVEIERKFLVAEIPNPNEEYINYHIKQGYLCLGDKEEVRIRSLLLDGKYSYSLTAKKGTGMMRGEYEISLNQEQFWELSGGVEKWIHKIRVEIPYNNNLIFLDMFSGDLVGLKIAEVEFDSAEEALNFVPPPWFVKDVTFDERYKNRSLVTNGLPQTQ